MSFQVNFNYQNQINLDPYETAQNFCDLYYGTVAFDGFSCILNLFDPNAHCNYNGHEILGMYSVMSGLASDGIAKMFYDQLTFTPMLIDNERLIIQVTGLCQSVTFWGALGYVCPFVETFVLKYSSGRVLVEGYIFKA
jgi:hypothetical protein